MIGAVGLLVLKSQRNPDITDEQQCGIDRVFLLLLIGASVSGLLLLALRETGTLGILLVLHLSFVVALFLTLPYSKFVHGIYRFVAIAVRLGA